jgi:hypothetical protein
MMVERGDEGETDLSGGGILGDELGGFGRHGGGDGGVGASASHPGVVVCGWQQKARHATR